VLVYQSQKASVVPEHAAQPDNGNDEHAETDGQQYLGHGDQIGAEEIGPFVELHVDDERDGQNADPRDL